MRRLRATVSSLLPALAVLLPAALLAQEQPPSQEAGGPPPACIAPEYRQFDFWIGEWVVTGADGRKAGENSIEQVLEGCALRESWRGAAGGKGYSFNIYDRRSGNWHQTWVDRWGTLLQLDGGLVGEAMVLEGVMTGKDGSPVLQRITWSPLEDGDVRQHWVSSADDGESWQTVFDGHYTRKTGAGD